MSLREAGCLKLAPPARALARLAADWITCGLQKCWSSQVIRPPGTASSASSPPKSLGGEAIPESSPSQEHVLF